jgi:ABC-type polysaccharide/polyol phosphate transport system ATPase subunit
MRKMTGGSSDASEKLTATVPGSPSGSGSKPVVEFCHVSKKYNQSSGPKFLRDHIASLFRDKKAESFYALNDVSFSLASGQSLAVVGPNGAGKSTLLSVVAGLSCPDAGSVQVNGSMAALLELGSGFHIDLTGEENIYLNASLLGLTRAQAQERFASIAEFAGIGKFIHEPLRTYSSGMVLRLAFSVAVNVAPDILLIDEVLAVGDQRFQQKCMQKIFDFKQAGKTIICVSHALPVLLDLCDKALWLEHGRAVRWGDAHSIIPAYKSRPDTGSAI